ncbi:MAG: hypothetical protein HKP49_01775 [Maribacter sp.]|nr:hypothetical protein [Maribacter sp.]
MSPFLILIVIIILVLVGLLFIPIDIYINTSNNQYYAEFKGLAKASIEGDKEELLRIKLRIPFKNFYFYPLRAKRAPKKIEKKKSEKQKNKNRFTPKTALGLIKSFTVKKWNVDLDTGNCITNAKLYPLFTLMNYHFGGFQINFEGRNHVFLWLRNRPIYIIKSIINP